MPEAGHGLAPKEPAPLRPAEAEDTEPRPTTALERIVPENSDFAVRRADHVGFSVASLDSALRFWVEGLGGQLVRVGDMDGEFLGEVTGAHGASVRMAIVSLAGQMIELLEYRGVDLQHRASRPFDPGFAHLALIVDDIDSLLARIAVYEWRPQGKPQVISGGTRAGTKVIYAVGPDGATIELMQLPEATKNHNAD
ncbi:MAG: glyoxalase/bleomycin resistance/dioxygenase family protein [Hyphomicrobiales bacterium]|nr:MAG: glyoxalase/bleomycin resistance/dioxygenase family protein [Hyphomicrobiales bacterium]